MADAHKVLTKFVQKTMSAANDSEDDIVEAEAAYRVKLNAHSLFMQSINDDMGLLFARLVFFASILSYSCFVIFHHLYESIDFELMALRQSKSVNFSKRQNRNGVNVIVQVH